MSAAEKKLAEVIQQITQKRQWHEFALPGQPLNFVALRNDLRDHNPRLEPSDLPTTVDPFAVRVALSAR